MPLAAPRRGIAHLERDTERDRHVILGASLAGLRAAEAMRRRGFDGEIVLVGAERDLPYHRPPLSKGVLGDPPTPRAELFIQPASFFDEQRIALRLGTRARRIDPVARRVELDTGEHLRYDRALIATGSEPRPRSVPGRGLPGVLTLRTLRDATDLASRLRARPRVVVVGVGLIGLEVASAARRAGCDVTVVEAGPSPLRRVLGDALGRFVAEIHADEGVAIRLGASVARLRGRDAVEQVILADGQAIAADLVVVGVGVKPATDWLEGSGIALDDGVIVDASCATNAPGVYAAGDVARAYDPLLGEHVRLEQYGNAHLQGAIAGRNMAGDEERHTHLPACSSEQLGHRLQILGSLRGGEDVVLRGRAGDRSFLAFHLRDGAIELKPQEALARAAALHDEQVRQFLVLDAAARVQASPELHLYLDDLRFWMRGNLDWSLETARYALAKGDPGEHDPRRTPAASEPVRSPAQVQHLSS